MAVSASLASDRGQQGKRQKPIQKERRKQPPQTRRAEYIEKDRTNQQPPHNSKRNRPANKSRLNQLNNRKTDQSRHQSTHTYNEPIDFNQINNQHNTSVVLRPVLCINSSNAIQIESTTRIWKRQTDQKIDYSIITINNATTTIHTAIPTPLTAAAPLPPVAGPGPADDDEFTDDEDEAEDGDDTEDEEDTDDADDSDDADDDDDDEEKFNEAPTR